ncbi:MAG: hypothetical protein ACTHMJ_05455 [Thermomicrobiales bacterium]
MRPLSEERWPHRPTCPSCACTTSGF